MKLSLATAALVVLGAGAQTTTVLAPCGTNCPSTVPDKTITRSQEAPTESTPCPSLKVSMISGASNGSSPMMPNQPGGSGGPSPSPTAFAGGAGQLSAPVGALVAVCGALMML